MYKAHFFDSQFISQDAQIGKENKNLERNEDVKIDK